MGELMRDAETGRFIPKCCLDPNCDGHMVAGNNGFGNAVWHCDGLTFHDMGGPLIPCWREHPRAEMSPTDSATPGNGADMKEE